MATKYLSIRELRPRLPSVVRDAAATSARYIVTRRGRPEAVILSLADYESLLETLEIQSDQILLRRLRKAQQELKRGGKGRSLQQIHKELDLAIARRGLEDRSDLQAARKVLREKGNIPWSKLKTDLGL